jgi:hypothetical protein
LTPEGAGLNAARSRGFELLIRRRDLAIGQIDGNPICRLPGHADQALISESRLVVVARQVLDRSRASRNIGELAAEVAIHVHHADAEADEGIDAVMGEEIPDRVAHDGVGVDAAVRLAAGRRSGGAYHALGAEADRRLRFTVAEYGVDIAVAISAFEFYPDVRGETIADTGEPGPVAADAEFPVVLVAVRLRIRSAGGDAPFVKVVVPAIDGAIPAVRRSGLGARRGESHDKSGGPRHECHFHIKSPLALAAAESFGLVNDIPTAGGSDSVARATQPSFRQIFDNFICGTPLTESSAPRPGPDLQPLTDEP